MDRVLWDKIEDDYRKAKEYLWCPQNAVNWHRDEDQGRYYMWCAYHAASLSEEKDSLMWARILIMMSRENFNLSEYERFHKFISPAKIAYDEAKAFGCQISDKELEFVNRTYDNLKYVLEKTDESERQFEEAYACIEGLNEIKDFSFHDSKPVHFEHQSNRALLKLDYYGVCVTLEFTELLSINVDDIDPIANWILCFYCYPLLWNPKYYCFDIGYYRIICEHIRVIEVVRG